MPRELSGFCSFFYLYAVYTGQLAALLNRLGINTMGREYIWQLTRPYYTLSPTYLGRAAVHRSPVFWYKRYGDEAALLYMALMNPITITYLTDNTAFYFWCTICLRLLPMAHVCCAPKEARKP